MFRRPSLLAIASLAALLVAPQCGRSGFEIPGFFSIVPPGQDGVLNSAEASAFGATGVLPPHVDDQLAMYEALVFQGATPGMTGADIPTYFKRAHLYEPHGAVERSYSPGGRSDVLVKRDAAYGVPHIHGSTREGAMFASGYTEAEDRLFLMDVLRRLGRARASEFLGASAGNLKLDADQLAVAPYTESDLTAQLASIQAGPDGPQIIADAQAWLDGVNQYVTEALADADKLPAEYPALQLTLESFVLEDVIAVASLVGGIFGKGGGGEVRNQCGLAAMTANLGGDAAAAADAREIFDDLTFSDDPEAPVTAPDAVFPYMSDLGSVDPSAIPDIDCASLQPLTAPVVPPPPGLPVEEVVPTPPLGDPPGGLADLLGGITLPNGLSNALLIAADKADGGRPIAVFGPQTGYFIPQLLVEKSVRGPGIRARGTSFAGTGIYVELGRGHNYAWSATSAGGDNVDHFVLELCEPLGGPASVDSLGYMHQGSCKEIESHTNSFVAKPSAGGAGTDVFVVQHWERAPDYGPLTARGTTHGGTPIAVAVKRTTYLAELDSARGFKQLNDPNFMLGGVSAFRTAVSEGIDYTFNWFYVDWNYIAYQHSCKCPQRAPGVDPYLPRWGTGAFDWQGFIPATAQPFSVNPPQGFLTSWNNKQAQGFLANDSNASYGPVYRSLMLDRRIQQELAEGPMDIGEAVDVMALAATTDLRAQEILGFLGQVMGATAPPGSDPRAQDMFDRLLAWAAADFGHRRDHDDDGAYDDPQAPAIMDAWWMHLVDAMFDSRSANARRELGLALHDAPQGHLGSAFQGGMYSQVHKDLRQVLGLAPAGAFSRTYCGGGDAALCKADLWAALDLAAADLTSEFSSSLVADWGRTRADDEVQHSAVGIATVPPIHWMNRPTHQQVVQLGFAP